MTTLGLGLYALGTVGLGGWSFSVEDSVVHGTGVRVIDPKTGDYSQVDGRIQRTTATRQRVITALSSRIKTSLSLRGIALPEYFTATTERDVELEFGEALAGMVQAGEIKITGVDVVTGADGVPGRMLAVLSYYDVFGGTAVTLRIG